MLSHKDVIINRFQTLRTTILVRITKIHHVLGFMNESNYFVTQEIRFIINALLEPHIHIHTYGYINLYIYT